MLERLSRHKRNIALAGLGLVVLWFSWTVRTVLNPLILGYLLAYVLHPMVLDLERRGWSRRAAANLIFIAFFLVASVLGVSVFFQGRALVADIADSEIAATLREKLPEFVWEVMGGEVAEGEGAAPAGGEEPESPPQEDVPGPPGTEDSDVDPSTIRAAVLEVWAQLNQEADTRRAALQSASDAWPYVRAFFGSIVALVTLIFLLPIYAYFLLFELGRIHAFVLRYLPARERERFSRIGTQIGEVLASFFRGRLLVCFLKGALIAVGLLIAGVPYSLFLGMASGFLALVPFVGPLIGFLFAFLITLVSTEGGLLMALLGTGLVFALAELAEGYVLLPKILGDSLGLHPVVVLASVFVGGAAMGMFGFLIALPLTAALVIIAREMVLPALADFADEGGEGGGGGGGVDVGGVDVPKLGSPPGAHG